MSLAPVYFSLGTGGAHPATVVVEPSAVVIDAAEACPTGAVRVFSADNGELIAPSSFD